MYGEVHTSMSVSPEFDHETTTLANVIEMETKTAAVTTTATTTAIPTLDTSQGLAEKSRVLAF